MTFIVCCPDCDIVVATYNPRAEGTPLANVFGACAKHVCGARGTSDIDAIFERWKASVGRNVRFTKQRRHLIERRLRDWPQEDLMDAVVGWRHSSHHRGENGDGVTYNSLELLLRDAAHIEMFRDLERRHQRGLPPDQLSELRAAGNL